MLPTGPLRVKLGGAVCAALVTAAVAGIASSVLTLTLIPSQPKPGQSTTDRVVLARPAPPHVGPFAMTAAATWRLARSVRHVSTGRATTSQARSDDGVAMR